MRVITKLIFAFLLILTMFILGCNKVGYPYKLNLPNWRNLPYRPAYLSLVLFVCSVVSYDSYTLICSSDVSKCG